MFDHFAILSILLFGITVLYTVSIMFIIKTLRRLEHKVKMLEDAVN